MKIESHICDIEDCEHTVGKGIGLEIQVIFSTDQTEGRSCPPYLSMERIDLCDQCYDKVIDQGNYIRAHGAMGHNKFYFRDEQGHRI